MPRKCILGIILTLVVGFCQSVYQIYDNEPRLSPHLLNYQGYLTDTFGIPITNPSLSMDFRIFDAVSGGNQKWTETQSVSVNKGIFNVVLGSLVPIPDSVFTKSTSRWLQLTAGGQTLSPRTRITSNGYAYTATYSDTAEYARIGVPGGPAGGDLTGTYPSPTIASSAVNSAKIADGSITSLDIRDTTLTTAKIKDLAVTNAKIASGITDTKLSGSGTLITNLNADLVDGLHSGAVVDTLEDFGRSGVAANLYEGTTTLTAKYVNVQGPDSIYTSSGTYAYKVKAPNRIGVLVDKGNGYGVYVDSTNGSGFRVTQADSYGVWIGPTSRSAICIDTTTGVATAIYIRNAGGNGIFINNAIAGHGVYVFRANMNGLSVGIANQNGVEVDSAARNGVFVNQADSCGVKITKANIDGLYADVVMDDGVDIDSAAQNGVEIGYCDYGMYVARATMDGFHAVTTMDDGLDIDSAAGNGVEIGNCDYGLYVSNALYRGVYIIDAGLYGVYANSDAQRGGYFRNNNNDYYALTALNNTGTGGTVRGLYIQGHGYATGGWQTFLGEGGNTGFSISSDNMEIMMSGSSSLAEGRAEIEFEKKYANVVSDAIPLKVIVTPTAKCNGICVVSKSTAGFAVEELMNGRSSASFDWIAIARIKGYEQAPVNEPIIADDAVLGAEGE